MTWTEQGEIDAYQANQRHGDYCYGTGYDRRWVTERAERPGTFTVLTIAYYVEGYTDDEGLVSEDPQHYGVTRYIESVVCTDPDDPGSTELDSQNEYDPIGRMYDDLADAEAFAKTLTTSEVARD